MKLCYSPTSPYVRKVLICARELGIVDRLELETMDVWGEEKIREMNPLGKVPCLIRDDGVPLFDSPVICEFLDGLIPGIVLFPAEGEARWNALRFQAIGDGIMDAAILRKLDTNREPAKQEEKWQARQKQTVNEALATLEAEIDQLSGGPLTIGKISVASALGYLDLRFAEDNWAADYPKLAAWFKEFADRPSMIATKAPDGH